MLIGSSVQVLIANPDSQVRKELIVFILPLYLSLPLFSLSLSLSFLFSSFLSLLQPSVVSLSSIIHALYEMDMAAVVRYVFRNNATPKLCALVPHIKPGYEVGVACCGY